MPKRQAQDGEVFEGVAAQYVHGAAAVSEVAADLSDGIREMVAVNLLPGTVWSLRYTSHDFPTIENVELLRAEAQFWRLGEAKMRHLLHDTSVRTAVDDGDGHFPAVYARRKTSRLSDPADLTAIFNECMEPGQLQPPTRLAYWGSWRTVLTWAVAHDSVDSLLPMSQDTLKAITREALMVGLSAGTIRNLWSAIENRHRLFGYEAPLAMRGGDFTRFSKAVASAKGMPSRLLFPIGVHHINQLLELGGLTLTQTRNLMMTIVGTVMCMRVNEIDQLQICDVLWGLDMEFRPMYQNTFACHIYKRKQDTARKGLYPRAGSAVFTRLRSYVDRAGLAVDDDCSKDDAPGARCRACLPLFPRIVNNSATPIAVSRQQVTNAVLDTLKLIGVDTCHYSGISMRRGGISAGLAARVPEPILFLQSGHGSNCAARNYMLPRDPHVLFETYLAFGLGL